MMANIKRWSEEEKIKALTIAEAISISEAAKQTGIPEGTIKRWRSERNRTKASEPNRTPKKLKLLQQKAIEDAVEEAKDYITERIKNLADDLYKLAEKAVEKVYIAISDPEEVPEGKRPEKHNRDGAAWVRSLVGVMSQAIDKAQLLSGQPTARPEVNTKHEYDITQRIIADPEAIELAEQLLRRAAGRNSSTFRLDGE